MASLPFLIWPAAQAQQAVQEMFDGTSPTGMMLVMASFVFMLAGALIAARLLHRRGIASLFGPWPAVRRDFVYGFVVTGAALLILTTIWSLFYDANPKTPFLSVLMLLPIAIPLILIQTAAEEVIFRGYLPQQLAARFRHPLIWFVLPQVLFGVLHYDPEALGPWVWAYVGIIALNGLMWMDLVRITGNLGVPWGWHFANNLFVMTVLGAPDTLSGFQWLSTPYTTAEAPGLLVLADGISGVLIWLVLRHLLLRPDQRRTPDAQT